MVGIDAGFLGLLLHPNARAPLDPSTKKPTVRAVERIEALVESLEGLHERIVIPTPALCEFLVLAGKDGSAYLSTIHQQGSFIVQPFDQRAALELAALELVARSKGSKRLPLQPETAWQKVKFDRQIVAIGKIHGVSVLYSDDLHVRLLAEDVGIHAVSCWELPLPASKAPLFEQLEDKL